MNRGAHLAVRVVRSAAVASVLAFLLLFVHRVALGWGDGSWWQHEDHYGLPVFGLFFGACLLCPLPHRWPITAAIVRSALFTAGLVACLGIVGAGSPSAQRGTFHLGTFLGIVGTCAFVGLLLSARPFATSRRAVDAASTGDATSDAPPPEPRIRRPDG